MLDRYLELYRGSKEDAFVGAAENSKRDLLEHLLAQGVEINCKESRFGATALHRAASRGSRKTVEFLLDNGAQLDLLDGNCMTPLMNACSTGKKKGSDVALLLLRRGADAKYVRAEDGMNAYKFALWGQCMPEVLRALLNAGASQPEPDFRVIHLR